MANAKRIKTFLWFDTEDGKMGAIRFPEGSPGAAGMVMTVEFHIAGHDFVALNGGPEIDDYWEKLLAGGGKPVQCGWLKDKYGVSWQGKAERTMKAMLGMVKLDLGKLEEVAK